MGMTGRAWASDLQARQVMFCPPGALRDERQQPAGQPVARSCDLSCSGRNRLHSLPASHKTWASPSGSSPAGRREMTSEEIDATVAAGDCEPLRQFRDVFEEELSSEISKRRTAAGFDDEGCRLERESSGRENLAGLALSGGGIRSATFCLGLLQAFHEFRLLR